MWTDSPDHAHTAAHKRGAWAWFAIDEACFAPDDTSKNPEIAIFKISDGMTAHSVPDKVENVTTQAQTPSMLRDALEIDSVIIAETGRRGWLMAVFVILWASFF